MDLIAEIKARREDYYSKVRRAELKQKSDTKNCAVLNQVINELSARASELTWVLQFMEPNKDLEPPLQQADVSGSLPPSDAEIEAYFKSGYGGDAGSAIYGAKWMKKEILLGGNDC